ncbi:hypothetical protein ACFLTM_04530 [Candidatus Bipolaricaulota bacterium]
MRRTSLGYLVITTALIAVTGIVGLGQTIGANPDFDLTAAEEEAYWYSRYNLGHLTMRAGMGDVFMPNPEMVEMMISIADADPDDGDTVSPPVNPALLRTVYAGGDPHWMQTADPADFATMRWDPESFDRRITGSALGWTIVKELEWAKQFHIDAHFGVPEDDFGAQWRFTGLVLTAMAKMQAAAWMDLHAAGEMVMVDDADPFVMLMAISNLAQLLGAEAMPHSDSNRYLDLEVAKMFRRVADEQFDRVIAMSTKEMSVKELSTAAQGLVWYAAATRDAKRQALALERIEALGLQLIAAPKNSAADIGYALRGMMEAYRVTGCVECLHASFDLLEELAVDFDEEHGIFRSQTTYTIDDVAAIVGGLNAVRLFGDADNRMVNRMLAGFFEGVVNLSGLQRSVPPIDSGKSLFEQDDPVIFYGYPGIPLPGEVDKFGAAPVFAASVTFDLDEGEWIEIDEGFDTAGAMHAANEFIWLHADEVNGFPIVEPVAEMVMDGAEKEEVCFADDIDIPFGLIFLLGVFGVALAAMMSTCSTCK